MNTPPSVQRVLSTYSGLKPKLWSKVAKRVVGFHLFGNRTLSSDWNITLKKWLDEIRYIEKTRAAMVILGGDSTLQFIVKLAEQMENRGLLTKDEAREMKSSHSIAIKPRNERAQAIITKLFFELSLMRSGSMYAITRNVGISIDDLIDGDLEERLTVYDNFGPIQTS
jgi:hypothetical protein